MDTTIKQLVDKFNDGTATAAERAELLMHIKSGQGLDILEEDLAARIYLYIQNPERLQVTSAEEAAALPLFHRSQMRLQELVPPTQPVRIFNIPWRWLAVAASISIIVVTGWLWFWNPLTTNQANTRIANEKVFTTKQLIHLPDGTTVLLNDNSQLKFDTTFGNTTREVFLQGEAYFDVAHNPTKPFYVHTDEVKTRVLGTAFNIKAYIHQSTVITVTRGRVEVSDGQDYSEVILPNEEITVTSHGSRRFQKTKVLAEQAIAWKSQFLILDNVTIAEAAAKITDKFGVAISVPDSAFRKCVIQTSFLHNEDLTQVLTILSALSNGSYTLAENKATISGSCR